MTILWSRMRLVAYYSVGTMLPVIGVVVASAPIEMKSFRTHMANRAAPT